MKIRFSNDADVEFCSLPRDVQTEILEILAELERITLPDEEKIDITNEVGFAEEDPSHKNCLIEVPISVGPNYIIVADRHVNNEKLKILDVNKASRTLQG